MTIVLPSNVRPSFATGYARNASESANPNLWPAHAWVPALGATGDTLYDVADGNDLTLTAMELDSDWTQSEYGAVVDIDNNEHVSGSAVSALSAYPFTIVLWGQRETDSVSAAMFGTANDAATNEFVLLGITGAGAAQFRVASGGSTNSLSTASAVDDTEFHVITGVGVSSTERHVFLDGGGKNTSTANRAMSAFNSLSLGRNPDLTPSYAPCNVLCCLIYNHALTDAEVAEISADPIAPFRRRIHIPLATEAEVAGGWQPYWGWQATRSIGVLQ